MGTVAKSIMERVRQAEGCWEWLGAHSCGYAAVWRHGRMRPAHRVVYELLVGPIPPGKQLDHLCRNIGCVNPAHLEPVTQRENIARGRCWERNRSKTHCPSGHPYDERNTGYRANGKRRCLTCHREQERKRRAA